ncbi:MAG TPA: aldehyde dehydrogenase family protein [Polyangia bacterium]
MRYGLTVSIFTGDAARADRVARLVRAGTVWINCCLVRDIRVPFGGVKDSGVGREGRQHCGARLRQPRRGAPLRRRKSVIDVLRGNPACSGDWPDIATRASIPMLRFVAVSVATPYSRAPRPRQRGLVRTATDQ